MPKPRQVYGASQAEGLHHLTPLYMVAILEDFKLDKINTPSYISHKCLCDSNTGEIFYDKLNFIFIELVKFEKAELELQTNLDKWLYLLKHLGRLDQKPQAMNNPIFEKLLRIAEYENLNREERAMYDESLKYKRDLINQTNFALEEAVGIAIEVSEAEREKAIESEKRSQDARKESVRVLKRKAFTPIEIAEISGFTLEEISEIHG